MPPIIEADLDNWFTYHPPTKDQEAAYIEIRETAKNFARAVVRLTPACADQTATIRKIREAVMSANATLACNTP